MAKPLHNISRDPSAVLAPADAHEHVFTCESVTEGHPDKVADFISDSILDAHLEVDRHSRVACETLVKSGTVILAGEITCDRKVDLDKVVRQAIRQVGYVDPDEAFSADRVEIRTYLTRQSEEIGKAVGRRELDPEKLGAGDQGVMFGYATNETPELMPLPALLAHRLTATLARHRKESRVPWLRPDGKSQVSVMYRQGRPVEVRRVLVSTQHSAQVRLEDVRDYVRDQLVPDALGEWAPSPDAITVNPAGTFIHGGPSADSGLTGRKIVVDSYGSVARVGGGCFSGKDPTKVDRSGAYYARKVARQIVKQGIAERAEIQVGYAIGEVEPFSLFVETFETGDPAEADALLDPLDFRPGAIIQTLDLQRPIYRQTTNYGHFGRAGLPWEE